MSETIYQNKYSVNQEVLKKSTEDNLDKVIALYKYIRDMTALRQKTILDIKDYHWSCAISQIPKDEENIEVFYRDRVEEDTIESNRALLCVHKPEFTSCPQPDESIRQWLLDGWDAFENGITCYQAIKKDKHTGEILEKIEELEEPEEIEEEPGLITLDDLLGEKKEADKSKEVKKEEEKEDVNQEKNIWGKTNKNQEQEISENVKTEQVENISQQQNSEQETTEFNMREDGKGRKAAGGRTGGKDD